MQALVQRAVLGVDRDDLGTRSGPRLLHHGRGGDEGLLVGQGQTLAGFEGGEGHGQPGESDDTVEHHVRLPRRLLHALDPDEHLGARGHARLHLAVAVGVADHHDVGMELLGLGHQDVGRALHGQCVDAEASVLAPDDVERLRADRA